MGHQTQEDNSCPRELSNNSHWIPGRKEEGIELISSKSRKNAQSEFTFSSKTSNDSFFFRYRMSSQSAKQILHNPWFQLK
jgi:hypothetical protein